MHTTQLVRLPHKSRLEASTPLDTYHLKAMESNEIFICTLPSTLAALVSLLMKNDCATSSMATSSLIPHASILAQYLQKLGYSTSSTQLTEAVINLGEIRVLKVLGWRIQVPTAESWISTYGSRLNVLTQGLLVPSLNWVWQQSILGTHKIMMHKAVDAELPPRKLAAGLFAVSLVGGGLLPLEALQPAKMSYEEWKRVYEATQPLNPHPQCVVPVHHSKCLLQLLKITVGVDENELQECARLAALAMRAVLAEGSMCGGAAGVSKQPAYAPHPVERAATIPEAAKAPCPAEPLSQIVAEARHTTSI